MKARRASLLPDHLRYLRRQPKLSGRLKAAAVAWGLFFAVWGCFAYWLHTIEYDPERVSLNKFAAKEELLEAELLVFAATATDDAFSANLDGLYEWMTEHGDCTINGKSENSWDVSH